MLCCCDVWRRVKHPNGLMKLIVEAIYPQSQGPCAPWIFIASSQLGAAVYGTFYCA
jgi:hypothetical protein